MEDKTLVVVDVQPGHQKYFDTEMFAKCLRRYKTAKNLIVVYNSQDLGYDTKKEVQSFFYENFARTPEVESFIDNAVYIGKEYGFLRDYMDLGVDEEIIVREGKKIFNQEPEAPDDIWLPDFHYLLKPYPNLVLVGGEKTQCLKEVELLLRIVDIPYKVDRRFTY